MAGAVGDSQVEAPVEFGVADFNQDSIFAFFQVDGDDVTIWCGGALDIFGKQLLAVKPEGGGVISAEAELGGSGLRAGEVTIGVSADPVGR